MLQLAYMPSANGSWYVFLYVLPRKYVLPSYVFFVKIDCHGHITECYNKSSDFLKHFFLGVKLYHCQVSFLALCSRGMTGEYLVFG